MFVKKSLFLILITFILFICMASLFKVDTVATKNIPQPSSNNSIEVSKDGNNINININTEGIKDDLNNFGDKAKEQYDKLNENGFFTKIGQWFESFINSIIDLFKSLAESI